MQSDTEELGRGTVTMLSVCIVNWNTRDYLRECLASLCASVSDNLEIEVIVVDNASEDGSAAMVTTEFPQVLLIANSENRGYAEGNNQALRLARGAYLLLLNPDVVVQPDSLAHALRFMQTHPDAGAMGCRLIGAEGETQRSVRGFPEPSPILWEFLGLSRLFPNSRTFGAYRMTYFQYNQPALVDQPMGSFLLITRAALEKVGLLDTQFPIFFNEVDWCLRAKQEHGFAIYYTPDVVVTHYGGGSTRQRKARMIIESHRSLLKFYDKHYAKTIAPALSWLIRRAVLLDEWRQLWPLRI